jgi:hypothetical protein
MVHVQLPVMRALVPAALLVFATAAARGQSAPAQGDDHRAVIEIGLAGERGVTGTSTSAGGTVAVEFTPIENWLELESGITALRGAGHNEFAVDLLFKKPWRLSATSEFMAGVGPELSYHSGTGAGTSVATEVVADWILADEKRRVVFGAGLQLDGSLTRRAERRHRGGADHRRALGRSRNLTASGRNIIDGGSGILLHPQP